MALGRHVRRWTEQRDWAEWDAEHAEGVKRFMDPGRLSTRDWATWDIEHPYVPKGDSEVPKAEAASEKAAPLDFTGNKSGAAEWGVANFKDWNLALLQEQQDAMSNYTQGGYGDMNHLLREDGAWISDPEAAQKNVDNLTAALASAPAVPETIVSRGTTLTGEAFDKMSQLKEGDTYTDKGFGSTSLSNGFGGNVRMSITLPEGLKGAGYPLKANDEREMILQRGMQYKVESTSQDEDGTLHLQMTALGSDVTPAATELKWWQLWDHERRDWAEWDAAHPYVPGEGRSGNGVRGDHGEQTPDGGVRVYKGVPSQERADEVKAGATSGPQGIYGDGLYVTTNPKEAEWYTSLQGSDSGKLMSGTLSPDAKIADAKDHPDWMSVEGIEDEQKYGGAIKGSLARAADQGGAHGVLVRNQGNETNGPSDHYVLSDPSKVTWDDEVKDVVPKPTELKSGAWWLLWDPVRRDWAQWDLEHPVEMKSMGRFTVRDWAEWDAEHPYIPHPKDPTGATPNNEGGPKSDHWGNWTKADPDAVRQSKIDDLTTRIFHDNPSIAQRNPGQLNQYIADRVAAMKPTTDWQLPNGTVVSITNGVRSSPEQQKEMMDVVEKLTNKYPPDQYPPPRTFNILDSKSATKVMGRALGATVQGGGQVWISPKVFAKDAQEKHDADSKSGFSSPAGAGHTRLEYTVTHEFGHTMDTPGHTDAVKDVMFPKSRDDYKPATSRYGQTDSAERYAEAFTEHELSNGQTEMALPKALAPAAGWK